MPRTAAERGPVRSFDRCSAGRREFLRELRNSSEISGSPPRPSKRGRGRGASSSLRRDRLKERRATNKLFAITGHPGRRMGASGSAQPAPVRSPACGALWRSPSANRHREARAARERRRRGARGWGCSSPQDSRATTRSRTTPRSPRRRQVLEGATRAYEARFWQPGSRRFISARDGATASGGGVTVRAKSDATAGRCFG